ncbi:MAG: hypothetical protein AAF517_17780 [Planctomycetota bacterium]
MRLSQIVAILKGSKARHTEVATELHRASDHPGLFEGFRKTFQPVEEGAESYPDEKQAVAKRADENLKDFLQSLENVVDVVASQEVGNADTSARADVVVDGDVVFEKATVPFLLYVEKQLTDLRTFVSKLPELDQNEEWSLDPNSGLHRTSEILTHRTKKTARPIVLYDATEEHPAQTQLVTDDITVGHWRTVKLSGALPRPRKRALLERIDRLQKAVKFAREEANSAEVESQRVGGAILRYLLKD